MSVSDLMPLMLLLLFSLALSFGTATVVFVIRQLRRRHDQPGGPSGGPRPFPASILRPAMVNRPPCWLAIKTRSLLAVQSALGLHNARPCSFIEGLAGEQKLFIAPPIRGWILVFGAGLIEPTDDVDNCFRFLLNLSRKLGEVQFFSASRMLHHHAWVRAERGRVIRAYAWAGRTLWSQGRRTTAENELNLICFGYAELPDRPAFGETDLVAANEEKVPLLAAKWSLDPACIDERFLEQESGVAGEPSRKY